jgi:ferritin
MSEYYKLPQEALNIITSLASLEYEQVSFYKRLAQQSNSLGYLRAEKYFMKESIEESEHFDKWLNYVNGRGNDFTIPEVSKQSDKHANLYELIEAALEKEVEVSKYYAKMAVKLFEIDQLAYQETLDFLKIQNEAVAIYTDYCAVLEGITEKGDFLTAEHSLFKRNN